MGSGLVPKDDRTPAQQGPSDLERRGKGHRVRDVVAEAGIHAAAERALALKTELAASLYAGMVDHTERVELEYLQRSFGREDSIDDPRLLEAFQRSAARRRDNLSAGLDAVNRVGMREIADQVSKNVIPEEKSRWRRW